MKHPPSWLPSVAVLFLMVLGTTLLQAAPVIVAEPITKNAFVGDVSAQFQVLATGDPSLNYKWRVQASGSGSTTSITGGTFATLSVSTPSLALNGNKYSCTVSDSTGSVNSFPATLKFYSAPTVTPTVTLSSSAILASSTNNITVNITGLNAGDTVRIDRVLDLNGNGQADIGEPVIQSFLVTDGQKSTIGGVTNTNVPADDDGVADGNIATHFSLPASPEFGRTAGSYLVRVTSPTGEFSPVLITFTVTQPVYAQSLSGQVLTSGSAPVPNAGVILISNGNNGGYVASTVADSFGNYFFNAGVGSYTVLATKVGYVASMASAPSVSLTAGQTLTSQNLALTPATCAIVGQVQDISGSPSLKGVQLVCQSSNGYFTLATSDASGNFDVPTLPDQWGIDVSNVSLTQLGYVPPANKTIAVTTNGSPTSLNLQYSPVTALIYGTVKDANGVALSGVIMNAGDNNNTYGVQATTGTDGSYVFGITGASGAQWQVGPSTDSNPALTGYLPPQSQNVTPISGSASHVNFTAQLPTAHLQGAVTINGIPLAGVSIYATPSFSGGNNNSISATTDTNGYFDFGVSAGNWNIGLSSDYADSNNLVCPNISETVANNQTISGIAYHVLNGSGSISGSVLDSGSNPLTQAGVNGNATISGTSYFAYAQTDNNGNYSFPIVNGVWSVSVSQGNYIQQTVTVTGSAQVNFTPPPIVAHLQGTVINNGAPVSGATIGASLQNSGNNAWVSTTTGTNGYFDLGLTSIGTWSVNLDTGYAESNNLVYENLSETVTNGQTISGIVLQVATTTGTISGRVVDSGSNPVVQTGVSGYATISGVSYLTNGQTDSNGNYSLPVTNGAWTINVAQYGYTQQTVIVSGSSVQVNFAPPAVIAHLQGTVTNNGVPVSGATIGASLQGPGTYTWFPITTDTNGNFDIGVTNIGTWNITLDSNYANSNNFVYQNLSETVSNGQVISGIAYQVANGTATISGSVVDSGSNPVAQTDVYSFATINGVNYNTNANTDSNGHYSFPVINGTWTVNVSQNGYTQQTVAVSGSSVQVNFAPPPVVAHLQGTVTKNGVPVSGAMIDTFQISSGNLISTTTGSNGYFDLGLTSAGTWSLNLDSGPVYPSYLICPTVSETVTNGETISGIAYQVFTATATISGSVLGSGGNPLVFTGIDATAFINGTSYSTSALTDGNGNYNLSAINGVWTVNVSQGGYAQQTVTVTGSSVQANFPYSPVVSWLLSKGFPSNANLQNAPNSDGVPLLMAYAFNLDPTRNQSRSIPKPVFSANQMSLTYYAGSAGVTYSVEASTDLKNWSTQGVTVSAPDANGFRTATAPITGSRSFMHLKLSY